jgi:hypothetical protein
LPIVVLPVPSFPWHDAQCWFQRPVASAATAMPAEVIMTIMKRNAFRFIGLLLSGCEFDRRNFNSRRSALGSVVAYFFSVRT